MDAVMEHPAADEEVALVALARLARGQVGADVERAVREARAVARRADRALCFADVAAALASGMPKVGRRQRWRTAIHEASHAIAHVILYGCPPAAVSVDGRGGSVETAAGLDADLEGVVGESERVLQYELAGLAGEELHFNDTSAGCGGSSESDLALATQRAMAMEGSFGWGGRHSLLYYDALGLRTRLLGDREFAARVHERLERACAAATSLLSHNQDAVEALAQTLMEQGSLEGEEILQAAGMTARTNTAPAGKGERS